MECVYCLKEAGEEYRVDSEGTLFCSDDCHDEYTAAEESDAPEDFSHPYIDTYEMIRFNYIDWLHHWESDLEKAYEENPKFDASRFTEDIDDLINAHFDFYRTEGDDGVFAKEIYNYLLKFEDLQKKIRAWRPHAD